MIKGLSLTMIAGIVLLINGRALLKNFKSMQAIVYIVLLCTGLALAWLYTSDLNIQSPFQTLEKVLDPVTIWLWG